MAEVLLIRFVSGSISFFPSRGSNGVNAPNYTTIKSKGKFLQKILKINYQFNNLDQNPIICRDCHEFKKDWR